MNKRMKSRGVKMENRLIEITINDVVYVWDYRKGWVLKGSGEPLVEASKEASSKEGGESNE